jgi:hypothetical protein
MVNGKNSGRESGNGLFQRPYGGGAGIIGHRDEQRNAASRTGYVCLRRFTVTGEWQEQAANEAMLVWLKRFSDHADVEKARAEFERCSKGRFAGIGPPSR